MHGFANWKLAAAGLAVAFMASWTTASAQTQDIDALKAKNRELETRLSSVEKTAAGQKLSDAQREETKNLVSEMVKAAQKDISGPAWAKDLKFSGDFRLRFESLMFNRGNNNITGTAFNNNNAGPGAVPVNTSGPWMAGATPVVYNYADADSRYKVPDRNRFRMRLRFGFEKTWKDADLGDFKVEFRLASGQNNDPTSANQTFGYMNDNGQNSAGFAKRPIWIDLAYATYQPKFLPGLSITGGKMKNPFFTNDLFWDTDVNPEGVWVKYAPSLMDGKLMPWFGMGMFVISEQANQWSDSMMWAYELGLSYKVTDDIKLSFATRYTDYTHYDSASNNAYRGNAPGPVPNLSAAALPAGFTDANGVAGVNAFAPYYARPDNDFGVIDLIVKAEFNVPLGSYKLPIEVYFDWAHNCKESYSKTDFIAFNQLSGAATLSAPWYNSGMNPVSAAGVYNRNYVQADDAYAVGIKAGKNVKKGDWSVGYKFAYIEANAMPGEWVDADLGFANRKGHCLQATYNLMDDLTIGASVWITQPVYSPDVVQNVMVDGAVPSQMTGIVPVYTDWWAGEDKTVSVQADLVWKF